MITLPSSGFLSPAPFTVSGGTSYSAGTGYTGVVFTSSGTFTVLSGAKSVSVLAIAGGCGGGGGSYMLAYGSSSDAYYAGGGGGAAGEYVLQTVTLNPGTYTVTVGNGGAAGTNSTLDLATYPTDDATDGVAGGASSFSGTGISTVTASNNSSAGGDHCLWRQILSGVYPIYGGDGGATSIYAAGSGAQLHGGGGAGAGGAGSNATTSAGGAGGTGTTVLNYTFGYGGAGGTAEGTSSNANTAAGSGGGGGTRHQTAPDSVPYAGRAGAVVLRWSTT